MIKFVKVGDSIQCQNCGNMFKIDELDSLELNQIAIINKKEKDGQITIISDELKALKSKFTNWQDSKAV